MMLDPDGWVYWFVCPELRRLDAPARKDAVKRTKEAIMKGKWFPAQMAAFLVVALGGYKVELRQEVSAQSHQCHPVSSPPVHPQSAPVVGGEHVRLPKTTDPSVYPSKPSCWHHVS